MSGGYYTTPQRTVGDTFSTRNVNSEKKNNSFDGRYTTPEEYR